MDEENKSNSQENQDFYDSPPEEVVENIVNVVTSKNSDGSVNRTTRRTKKTIVTTVRKICVKNSVPINEVDENITTINENNKTDDSNKGLIINTITSEGDGGTSATFAYLPPTTKVSEYVVEENSEKGERKTRTHTTTTSISATALLNTRSKFKTESSTSTDRLLKFYNPDSSLQEIEATSDDTLKVSESDHQDVEDVKNYLLPDGSKVIKKHSKVSRTDGASAEKEHISVIPISHDESKDGQIITAEKCSEKLETNNTSRTTTTTTTITKRILSSPIPKAFKTYFQRNEKRPENLDEEKKSFDGFLDFWDLNVDGDDDNIARKQIIESERHFREQFKLLQNSMNRENSMSQTGDAESNLVITSSVLNGHPGELLRGNGSLFESFFSGMPLYQSYGMLAQNRGNDGRQLNDFSTPNSSLALTSFPNNSEIFKYLEDITAKAFSGFSIEEDPNDRTIKVDSIVKPTELQTSSTNDVEFESPNSNRDSTLDEEHLQDIGEQLASKAGPSRVAWSEMPEVYQSNFKQDLKKQEIQLQEAMFEVITSEASYYHSLTILVDHFYNAPQFNVDTEANLDEEKSKTPLDILGENESSFSEDKVLKPIEKRHLFSNVLSVCLASRSFLQDLESRWIKTRPYLPEICDLIVNHANSKNFQPYIIYLRNQNYQIKTLKELLQREEFRNTLSKLHSDPKTGKNHLDSFLALPMQRLTRLKMLCEVIMKLQAKVINSYETDDQDTSNCSVRPEHISNAEKALQALKTLLSGCENEQKLMDQKSRILELSKATVFPDNVKAIAFGSKFIVKEGELKTRHESKQSMLKIWPPKKTNAYYFILFHDLLLITKFKPGKEGKYIVMDYCQKDSIETKIEEFSSRTTPPNNNTSQTITEGHSPPEKTPRTNNSFNASSNITNPPNNSNSSSIIGSLKSKNISKAITTEINPTKVSQKLINRSSSTISAKSTPNGKQNLSKSSNSPSSLNSSIDINNTCLHLNLTNSHNGTFNSMKLFASTQGELLSWLDAFQKPFTF